MCGIIGYVGQNSASPLLLSGLRRLEYRGYDSAGMALLDGPRLIIRKCSGRVEKLARRVGADALSGTTGIAHTRWATHGRPSVRNAHPHLDFSGRIALVHNGLVENHAAIRSYLEKHNVEVRGETDTEALAHLIGLFYQDCGDLPESVRQAMRAVMGACALAVICSQTPDRMVAARRGSPLVVGAGPDEFFVASDASAITAHTRQVAYLNDNEITCLSPGDFEVMDANGSPVPKSFQTITGTQREVELSGYAHYMAKEINEQPETLRSVMRGRIDDAGRQFTLPELAEFRRELPRCRRVWLFGCGTAWHAALIGRHLFEELAGLPAEAEYSSELRYRNPIVPDGTLAIAISQSGETADTLAALREVRRKGALAIGVVNAVGSTMTRETDGTLHLHAGPEISVASTKAFIAQVALLAMMAADLGRRRHLLPESATTIMDELRQIPEKTEKALELGQQIRGLAYRFAEWDHWFYLGRGINFPVSLEGALKIKEISYIHAEGLPAAEMKHGPIALIDDRVPVVAVAPQDASYEKMLANIEEIRSRDGRVIAVTNDGDPEIEKLAEAVLCVPWTLPALSPLVTTIPLQLLAYHTAVIRGHDVDKPRNLAKSVTVE